MGGHKICELTDGHFTVFIFYAFANNYFHHQSYQIIFVDRGCHAAYLHHLSFLFLIIIELSMNWKRKQECVFCAMSTLLRCLQWYWSLVTAVLWWNSCFTEHLVTSFSTTVYDIQFVTWLCIYKHLCWYFECLWYNYSNKRIFLNISNSSKTLAEFHHRQCKPKSKYTQITVHWLL